MSRYRRCAGFSETPVEDELFLVDGDSGDIFHLDRMALPLWRALDVPTDESELLVLFQEAFPDIPAQTIEGDLRAAVSTMLQGGLIEVCD